MYVIYYFVKVFTIMSMKALGSRHQSLEVLNDAFSILALIFLGQSVLLWLS
jgi:hypothetical protein